MEDWWQIVFEQFDNPKECLELGFTCKRATKMLQTLEPKFKTFYSNKAVLMLVLKKHNCTYVEIETFDSMTKIANWYLITTDFASHLQPTTAVEYNYFGLYYDLGKQIELAKTYYSQSADLNCSSAMYNLFLIYKGEGNKKLWKMYLKRAVEKGCCEAMNNLGEYYEKKMKYSKMETYLTMAVEKGNYKNLGDLARHHDKRNKDKNKALELYELDSSLYQCRISRLRKKLGLD